MLEPHFLADFRYTVDRAADRLLACSDAAAAARPAPGKWSRKEIIGHLIDSAANNHGRFVRGQLLDDLVFEGYDQDAWVRIGRYQDRRWHDLVRLWTAVNHHIADLMAAADPDVLARPRARHNLDAVAFQPVSRSEPATLEYFMRDYVAHLKHHLAQALPDPG